ncbi:iron dependent repressor, metal binding and dimerization domain protein [Syntrophomonas palmitatica]
MLEETEKIEHYLSRETVERIMALVNRLKKQI